MSILAVQKQKDATAGFATDFLDVLGRLGPILTDQPKLKIVTNAGGMNPRGVRREGARAFSRRRAWANARSASSPATT